MPFCKQCGANVSETAKFCEKCGTKLKAGEQKPTTKDQGSTAASVPKTEKPDQATGSKGEGKGEGADTEELDLTALDKKVREGQTPDSEAHEQKQAPPKQPDNIINLNEILESDEKKELDSSIKREVLADDEVFSKICPMCGEEMNINKQLLGSTPVLVKCLKCGNETKIW